MSVPAQTIHSTLIAPSEDHRLVALADPHSAAAEQYRVLNQKIERLAAQRALRVLAVTSSTRREGRTTTAVNLALTAAQTARQVVLVEFDLRWPSMSTLLDLAPRSGVAEVLSGTAELGQALCRVGPLSVLCAGETRDPGQTLRSRRLLPLINELRASYDLVLLDVPPALAFADADHLAASSDGVLLVVRAHSTPRTVVRLAVESLGEKLTGIVVNDVDVNGSLNGRYLYADPAAA